MVVGEEQRVTPFEGLKALTLNSAYEYFEENTKIRLKAGKVADLVFLDENPLKVNAAAIRDTKVFETTKDGKTILKSPAS